MFEVIDRFLSADNMIDVVISCQPINTTKMSLNAINSSIYATTYQDISEWLVTFSVTAIYVWFQQCISFVNYVMTIVLFRGLLGVVHYACIDIGYWTL